MRVYESDRHLEILSTIFAIIFINMLGVIIIGLLDSYLMLNLVRVTLALCNLFYIYHIGTWATIKYQVTDSDIVITAWGGLKKVIIPINSIECFTTISGKIEGIAISGISNNRFSIGRVVVKNLGTSRMFVPSSREILYLKTESMNYGISPLDMVSFKKELTDAGIKDQIWNKEYNKARGFYKEKNFIIPLIISSIIVLLITFMPMILYVFNKLPDAMPLTLSGSMDVVRIGTDKQFVFSQMIYGGLNMAVLFCMYFAAHFCAKYDKKVAYRYIYVSLAVAILFLYIQIRLLMMTIK